jgi:thiol-activated cytolysin
VPCRMSRLSPSALYVAACLASACAGTPDDRAASIDAWIASIGKLPADPNQVKEGTTSPPTRTGDYSCTTTNLAETRQYDRIVAFAANSDSLWPGAIIRGDSVYSGLFTQTVFDRQPLTFSISMENLGGAKKETMREPSLSEFRSQLGAILAADVTGATAANIYSEVEQVHSEKQLSLALGASVAWGDTAKIAASFNFSDTSKLSRYLVKYTQAYYTIDVDDPGSASSFLGPSVTLDEVKAKLGHDDPPVYVSSVTYGRMVVFTFESTYSAEEMGAALDFAYKGGVDVSGNVSVKYKDMLENSKITAYILGGSGKDAVQAIDGYDALITFIKSGGNYSKDSPGAPIAYKLSYLGDNSPARMSFTQDYTVTECTRVNQRLKVTLNSIKVESTGGDAGGDLELYGAIWARGAGGVIPLFTKDTSSYVVIKEGDTWPQQGTIAETVLDVSPKPGATIVLGTHLFDYDPTSADDDISGGEQRLTFKFEDGWRREVKFLLTGNSARVTVTLNLQPI